jgi:hypothetical protein
MGIPQHPAGRTGMGSHRLHGVRMDFVVVQHVDHLGLLHYRISAVVLLVSLSSCDQIEHTWSGQDFVGFIQGLHFLF